MPPCNSAQILHAISDSRHPPSRRVQLALENENQHVFEYIKVEIARLKKSVGALSGVVDEELATLDSSTCVMRPEIGSSVSSTSHDTDWVDMRCWRSAIAQIWRCSGLERGVQFRLRRRRRSEGQLQL